MCVRRWPFLQAAAFAYLMPSCGAVNLTYVNRKVLAEGLCLSVCVCACVRRRVHVNTVCETVVDDVVDGGDVVAWFKTDPLKKDNRVRIFEWVAWSCHFLHPLSSVLSPSGCGTHHLRSPCDLSLSVVF